MTNTRQFLPDLLRWVGFPAVSPVFRPTVVGRPTLVGRLTAGKQGWMAVAFLASDASSYITGAVLPIDGGLTVV